ncbi:hypothetical protein IE53DRAFT_67717 [Violaceomyces palustris]|uniref:Uncharacterized protein n=1 Tax=Violaceomyces palustris TaxID=1673888 RepID=A0ACD0NYV0_9BASI|nr:hypothetical protein IE53DRAFT_67717 [Violaceomyces palustris]
MSAQAAFRVDTRSESASRLQSSIQAELATRGYSNHDDPIMAEYIVVMLANQKSPEQITQELSELIGPDYDPQFTHWIWSEADRIINHLHQPAKDTTTTTSSSTTTNLQQEPTVISIPATPLEPVIEVQEPPYIQPSPTASRARSASPPLPLAPHRGASPSHQTSSSSNSRIHEHHDGSGYRDFRRSDRWDASSDRGREQARRRLPQASRELFTSALASATKDDRRQRGVPSSIRPSDAAWDAVGSSSAQERNASSTSNLAMDDPNLRSHATVFEIPKRRRAMMTKQHQPSISIQGVAKQVGEPSRQAAMQTSSVSIFGRAGIPDPRASEFVPQALSASQQQQSSNHGSSSLVSRLDPMIPDNKPLVEPLASSTTAAQILTVPVQNHSSDFPTEPSNTATCRWSLKCTNPMCIYSHPTPANAGRDGDESAALILSQDVCRFGSSCTNKECTRSHVSPAITFIKQRNGRAAATAATTTVLDSNSWRPTATTSFAGGQGGHTPSFGTTHGSFPCKFQMGCTNASCPYSHFDSENRLAPSPALAALGARQGSLDRTHGQVQATRKEGEEEEEEEEDVSMDAEADVEIDLSGSGNHVATQEARGGEGEEKKTKKDTPSSLSSSQPEGLDRALSGDPSSRPCRFGKACTRPDCFFSHPPERNLTYAVEQTASPSIACRFGLGCTRGE